jgi:hypothetical protein
MRSFGRQDGIALVKILFLTSILLAVAAFAARGTRVEIGIARNDYLRKQALQIAEAGLDHAWRKIAVQLNAGTTLDTIVGNPTGFLGVGSTQTLDGVNYTFVSFGGTGNGYYVRIDSTSDDPGPNRKSAIVTSIGSVPTSLASAQRQLRSELVTLPLFGHGIFGKYEDKFGGGAYTDSYNSTYANYDYSTAGSNGSVGSNGDITNNGSPTTINGDATAGGTFSIGQSTVTGAQESGAPQIAIPPSPSCPQAGYGAYDGGSITGGSFNNGNGQLRGNGSDNIVLTGGTYCFSSITIGGQATLTVSGGAAVKIYLTSPSTIAGGGILYSAPPGTYPIPSNLQIYSTYNAGPNGNQGITFSGGSAVYAAIYAPEAALNFQGAVTDFYGAAIGGTISMGAANFHYDEALEGFPGSASSLVAWHEVRH